MKPLRKHLKLIALFLAVTFLVQSCNVYTYKPTTVDEAVKTNLVKVKTKSKNSETYRFNDLENINNAYYGIAHKNSKTAKKLSDQITNEDEFNYVKILLKEEQLNRVYLKMRNKTLSIILPYAIGIVIIGGLLYIGASGIGGGNWEFSQIK